MSGKGSTPRPFSVPDEEYAENYDRIFRKSGFTEHVKPGKPISGAVQFYEDPEPRKDAEPEQ